MRAWHVSQSEPREFRTPDEWDRVLLTGAVRGLELARIVIADPDADAEAVVLARSAESRALFDLGRTGEAVRAANEAVTAAAALDHSGVAVTVELSISALLAEAGDVNAGIRVVEELSKRLEGEELARAQIQHGYLLHHAGRLREALTCFDEAERTAGLQVSSAFHVRLRLNRGLVLLQLGRMREAERDFLEAESAALDGGLLAPAALCRANLAVLRGRSRQLVKAVADFDLARERFREAGDPLRPVAIMHIDRAEVMMHSGLLYDALDAAQRAHQLVEPTGNRMLIGDALLLVARTELAGRAVRPRRAQRRSGGGRVRSVRTSRHGGPSASDRGSRSAPPRARRRLGPGRTG